MTSICLLCSGGLGFKALLQIHQSTCDLVAVFTDKQSNEIIDYCKINNISLFIGNPRNNRARSFIDSFECDFLLSINYLFIIESDLILLPKKSAINIHGSLLPKYRGRTPHVWAIINGETETGITAHLINEKVDDGDILLQRVIPIEENDTGNNILEKFNKEYPKIIEDLLKRIMDEKELIFRKQDITKKTYFGKRTPTDGKINWDWSKQRIRNWIRAQAKPYPGAFTFFNEKKIIIHQAIFDDLGFHFETPNGTVLDFDHLKIWIKTPNGVILLSNLEYEGELNIKKGDILI